MLKRPFQIILSTLFLFWVHSVAAGIVDVETLRNLSRISLKIDPSIQVEFTKVSPKEFTLQFIGLTVSELGSKDSDLLDLKDKRLKSLQWINSEKGALLKGEWNFPVGKEELLNPEMETYLYKNQKDEKVIFDFWLKTGPTKLETSQKKVAQSKVERNLKAEKLVKERLALLQKQEKENEQLNNIGYFCEESLKEGVDLFLPYYPLYERYKLEDKFKLKAPDAEYPYLEPNALTDDAKYYNLALSLYRKEKFALALKAIEFHEKEIKKSDFKKDLEFLKANLYLKLEQKEKAFQIFTKIKDQQKGHTTGFYAAIYLAMKAREEGNELLSYELFSFLYQNYPEHEDAWIFRLVAAESLYDMKQTDRAADEFIWLSENGKTREAKIQGALRIGSSYLYRKQYDKVIATTFNVQKRFPNEASRSAVLSLNRAESLYWLGQYEQSKEAFQNFLKNFSSHPAGWKALLRLAEIEGRKPNGKGLPLMREKLLETINRFPLSPGATLARMRLIPCGDHAGYTAESAEEFYKTDVKNFNGNNEIFTENFEPLKATLLVKTFILFNKMDLALSASLKAMESISRNSYNYKWLIQIQEQIFRKAIVTLLNEGKNYEAAKFFDDHIDPLSENFLDEKNEGKINPDYLLKLSRVVSDLGVGSLAKKVFYFYAKSQTKYEKEQFIETQKFKELGLNERKKSEQNFTEALALFTQSRKKNESDIRKTLAEVSDHSPYSYYKTILLALLDEESEKPMSSLHHVTNAELLLSQRKQESKKDALLLKQWIIDLQIKTNAKYAAIDGLTDLLKKYPAENELNESHYSTDLILFLGVKSLRPKEDHYLKLAELYSTLNKWGECAKTYEDLLTYKNSLKANEGNKTENRIKVELARALLKTNERSTKAKQLLEDVAKSSENDFWKDLAKKTLVNL